MGHFTIKIFKVGRYVKILVHLDSASCICTITIKGAKGLNKAKFECGFPALALLNKQFFRHSYGAST